MAKQKLAEMKPAKAAKAQAPAAQAKPEESGAQGVGSLAQARPLLLAALGGELPDGRLFTGMLCKITALPLPAG